jgi:tetratricopeptide (TPR) repeat protein
MSAENNPNLPNKILIIDDDPSVPQALEEPLSRYNCKVEKASNLETALYKFNTIRFDVVLIEIEFAPLAGLALVQKWRAHEIQEKRCTAFIMMSGNKSLGNNEGLIKELGDLEAINKPFTMINLLPYLSRGMATKKRLVAYQEMKGKIVDYYNKTKDFDKAAAQVKSKLAEMGPKGLNLMYDLYEKANRFEDALSIVTPMLDRDPSNITLLNAKGRLLMRMGRFNDAKVCLQKSDELAPQNIDRLNELATAFLHLKDPDNSVKRFKQVLDLSPEQPELKFNMFSQLFEKGFDEQAIQFGKDAAQPAEIVRHYNNKGVMLSKDGSGDQAVNEYQRALRFFPKYKENYRIYYNIALAHIQKKTQESYIEAEKQLKHCLELAPDFEKAKTTLETVERSLIKLKKVG